MNIHNIEIPESFLQEEVREGYRVSAEMKKVWATEIDLFSTFSHVCKKYDIEFYPAYGTVLGAVRHGGFIPWDDDIDVVMTRENYNKFVSLPDDVFEYPYFLQNEKTDKGSHITFCKLRNSETAAICNFETPYRFSYNRGIFLDIFPLDNLPDDEDEYKKHAKRIRQLKVASFKWANYFDSGKIYFGRKHRWFVPPIVKIARFIVRSLKIPNVCCKLFDKEIQKYNGTKTEFVSMKGLGNCNKYPSDCFAGKTEIDFEFIKMEIPEEYDRLLTAWYGDWKTPVKGGTCHEGTVFDTEKSYKEYDRNRK